MFTLDIDNYRHKALIGTWKRRGLLQLFFSVPMPFEVRLSSSYKGLHIRRGGVEETFYLRDLYDDPIRLRLDDYRHYKLKWEYPLTNRQWNQKGDNLAGEWVLITNQGQILDFFNRFCNDLI